MKKFMLLMMCFAILATSAFAHDAKTQPEAKPGHIAKVAEIKKVFTNVLFYCANGLSSTVYITATNTSTSQNYYLNVTSTFPSVHTDYISIPTGTYDIAVSLSESASIYINPNLKVCDTYYQTFYGVTITEEFARVVDVQYGCE